MFSIVFNNIIAVASAFDRIPMDWALLDCRALIDGSGNAPELIFKIVEDAIEKIKAGQRLCFVCDYGQSRSNLLAALLISKMTRCSITDSISIVHRAHPESAIKAGLLKGLFDGKASRVRPHIAVTGGNGLIGVALVSNLLDSGKSVTILSRAQHGNYLNNSQVLIRLLNEYKITDIIHLAYPKPYNSYSTMAESFSHLISIAEASIAVECKLHYISSWAVYDGNSDNVVTEDTLPKAYSLYAQSKLVQEDFLKMQSANQGLKLRIYRLPGIYDSQSLEPRFLRYFVDCIHNKREIFYHSFSNGSAVVPLCSKAEIAKLLSAAYDLPPGAPSTLNLSPFSSSCSIQEIALAVGDKYRIKVVSTPVNRIVFSGSFSTQYLHLFGQLSKDHQSPMQSLLNFLDNLIKSRK